MLRYAIRRIAVAVPLLLATSFIVFSFVHLAPGSPETILLGGRHVDAATIAAIRRQYHLNDPFIEQYWYWLRGVLHGDFGESIAFKDTVWSVVTPRILATLELALYATLIVFLVGVTLGVLSALRRGGVVDVGISTTTLVLSSVSAYVSAILLIVLFAVHFRWFPVFGLGQGLGGRLHHLTLPAVALAVALVALVARVTRTSMIDALNQEFIETARSRGLSQFSVIGKHALRNAFVPVLTISGLTAGYLISGAVLVEYTFGLNGLGALLVQSVQDKDFAVVQAVTLIFTSAFILINLAVDLLYGVVDPRVRLERKRG
jgi:peptide/nickel transport system permease protein